MSRLSAGVSGLAGVLVLELLLLTPRRARAADPDPWWGHDKALHFSLSAGLSAAGYGAFALWTDDRRWRVLGGALIGLTAGTAKEGLDAVGSGDASWRDFSWDVVGTATGVGVAALVDWWCCSR